MLKNWNDPVGNKIKSNVKKSTDDFNKEKSSVQEAIRTMAIALNKSPPED